MADGKNLQAEQVSQDLAPEGGRAEFPTLDATQQKKDFMRDLDFILDIPLHLSAELGRTSMIINDLLQLGQGSVIELTKLAGEPLEILVNGKLIARGEPVVVNEKFGVRITDIISPLERVKQLA
jgi:flagellar motor switch protein FliN